MWVLYLNLSRGLFKRPDGLVCLIAVHGWAALAFRWTVDVAVPGVRVTADNLSLVLMLRMLTVIAPATPPTSPGPSSSPCTSWSAPRSPVVASAAGTTATVAPLHVLIVSPRGHLGDRGLRQIATIRVTSQISFSLMRRRRCLECRLPAALNASMAFYPLLLFPLRPWVSP